MPVLSLEPGSDFQPNLDRYTVPVVNSYVSYLMEPISIVTTGKSTYKLGDI